MKTALVTGALGGIGQAICRELQAAGYTVIATDNGDGECACERYLTADLRELHARPDALAAFAADVRTTLGSHGLDVLINNAAIQLLNRTDDVSLAEWDATLTINVVAPFLLTQLFLQELERAKGSVINIGSIHAAATKPGFVAYATSKAALAGLTRAMAVDLGSRIRVNCLNPAATATPMLLAGFADQPEKLEELAGMHPLGRIADPAEIARAAVFLASANATFITGATLQVDGGIGARLHDPV
jgi:NAD(P)-dependent dehydrogenase (short-subunit alcohol dehydrogenase family)